MKVSRWEGPGGVDDSRRQGEPDRRACPSGRAGRGRWRPAMSRAAGALGIVLGLLVVAGCATPYQPRGSNGGYADTRLDTSAFRVEFDGNEVTPRDTVITYLLYRCAELSVQAGYDYFVIAEFLSRPTFRFIVEPVSGDRLEQRQSLSHIEWGATATIRGFKGERPAADRARFDAKELLAVLRGEKAGLGDPPYDAFDPREMMRLFASQVKRVSR